MKTRKEEMQSMHHIICKSRKGKTTKANMACITKRHHQFYHALFDNKTPEEILDMLVHYFWMSMEGEDGMKFIDKYMEDK